MVDSVPRPYRLPDRYGIAVADANLLGLTESAIWLCALSVSCSFLRLGFLRWIALGLSLFGTLLVQRSCFLRYSQS